MTNQHEIIHRCDLASLVPPGGLAIELGVAAGEFSAALLEHGPQIGQLFSVDRWSDHHDEAEYLRASGRLSAYGERSVIVRMEFARAVVAFSDGGFDLVYIDGYAHTGQEGGETLRQWWPKVRPGGIFAGHDYCAEYPQTRAVVDTFVREHELALHVTAGPCDKHPSWWVRRPLA